MPTYTNPVLAGMHPDPSVCRRGDDYYLVCSSFEYWPALPLFHSRDLVRWRPIGYALDRAEQARVDVDLPTGDNGAYAATIRFHDGWFYISGTLVRTTPRSGNFIVKTPDPAGAWSDPVWLPHVEGIDPALFFDAGRVFISASRHRPREGVDWACEVTLQELHPDTFAPLDEAIVLTRGVVQNATAAEAPRLLRKDGYVYLMIAEGGTAQNHAVTVLRARDVRGPYEVAPHNPILTHRHLGHGAPVVAVGHADWVQTQQGDWWMVALAQRPLRGDGPGYHDLLGRETFLLPMTWEDNWPICCPGSGQVPVEAPAPNLPPTPASPPSSAGFGHTLGPEWTWLRTPHEVWWRLQNGMLRMRPLAAQLGDTEPVAMLLRRHQHHHAEVQVQLNFEPDVGQQAGLVLFYNDHNHVQCVRDGAGLSLLRGVNKRIERIAQVPLADSSIQLRVQMRGLQAEFAWRAANGWRPLGHCPIGHLCAAKSGGFVGMHIGVYAAGFGGSEAVFSGFSYQGVPNRSNALVD
jgi:xylan 1,4-beta-xylosidase